MYINNGNRSSPVRGVAALCAIMAMGLGLMASPADAAPFGYVANSGSNNVSVIDTATNTVVATVVAGSAPGGVAVAPDGKHAYVANSGSNNVSVIDTAINMVVATIPVGGDPIGVAVTPDGKHAYVANAGPFPPATVSVIDTATNIAVATIQLPGAFFPVAVAATPDGNYAYVTDNTSNTVSVIVTATNTVVATVVVGHIPVGVAVSPDGKHVYVANNANGDGGSVSVIATATNTVVATVQTGGINLEGIAITPDGKHVYVATDSISGIQFVSVIATATNTVVAQVEVAGFLEGIAITPDGKHAYVTNEVGDTVSVIDTATNEVVATVPVGTGPRGVGIVPPPPGVPFLAFGAVLKIDFGSAPNTDAFTLGTSFTLSSRAPAFNPRAAPVTLHIGTFTVTIPAGSFFETGKGVFSFEGVISGVTLKAQIKSTGASRYNFQVGAQNASLTGTQNAVYVTLAIGGDSGATSVTAQIFR